LPIVNDALIGRIFRLKLDLGVTAEDVATDPAPGPIARLFLAYEQHSFRLLGVLVGAATPTPRSAGSGWPRGHVIARPGPEPRRVTG
jgi:hypothetical protein